MNLTFHEANLIEAIRNGTRANDSDLTVTISFGGAGVSVCWKSQGIQGNGVGTSFDEAYEAAFQDHLQKVGRIISGEPKQSQSDPGFTDLH